MSPPSPGAFAARARVRLSRAADELAHQLRPAEDPGGRRQEGCAGQSLAQMPELRADAVSPRARGKPVRLPQLRPPPAPRRQAAPRPLVRRGAVHSGRAAEGAPRSPALPRPEAL